MRRCLMMPVLFSAASLIASADTAAVLPFSNGAITAQTNAQSNLDWIGESIAETVRDALTMRGLLTLDRADIQEAFHRLALRQRAPLSQASVIKIGETLDAEHVL